jgi:hypothetical protein
MHAQHDVLAYSLYPATITPLTLTTSTQLDNHHRANLTRPTTPRMHRALAAALAAWREPAV